MHILWEVLYYMASPNVYTVVLKNGWLQTHNLAIH